MHWMFWYRWRRIFAEEIVTQLHWFHGLEWTSYYYLILSPILHTVFCMGILHGYFACNLWMEVRLFDTYIKMIKWYCYQNQNWYTERNAIDGDSIAHTTYIQNTIHHSPSYVSFINAIAILIPLQSHPILHCMPLLLLPLNSTLLTLSDVNQFIFLSKVNHYSFFGFWFLVSICWLCVPCTILQAPAIL